MSIKIHHGPNGSFKTSGAIQDDAIPAAKSGRVIVTNVRGLTKERFYSVYPDLPESFDVINISMDTLEGIERLRRWFEWAPIGAFIIFDETQLLFLKSWRDADLRKFDFPGGVDAAFSANRPAGFLDAWTRHRHFNWDVVLTTPNIKYIRDDIRQTCECAYLHGNLGALGIRGRYKEGMHNAQDNRPSVDSGSIIQIKRIRQSTFSLYDSTSTGVTTDTTAGTSIFRSYKLLFLLALIAGCFVYDYMHPDSAMLGGSSPSVSDSVSHKPNDAAVSSPSSVRSPIPPSSGSLSQVEIARLKAVADKSSASVSSVVHPFSDRRIDLVGVVTSSDRKPSVMFRLLSDDGRVLSQSDRDLSAAGYVVTVLSSCLVDLRYPPTRYQVLVKCPGSFSEPIQRSSPGRAAGATHEATARAW